MHEARKALKRLRALLRLLEDELGERAYEHESAVVRDAGKQLAGARDAEVLLRTLDDLLERQPKLTQREGGRRLRARLRRERDGAADRALAAGASAGGDGALAELLALRMRIAAWRLDDGEDLDALAPALARIYGQGRKRMRRAARAPARTRARKLHEWRKRAKDLRYVAEMLDRAAADAPARGKRAKRARRQAKFVGNIARRADDLGELLGEEHDLAVLAERVRAAANAADATLGRGSRKALLKAIERRRRRLRKRALREGAKLYDRKPKRFVRKMRRATTPPARV